MAGKAEAKPKAIKSEPKVSMACIDDLLLRIGGVEDNVDGILKSIDDLTQDKLITHEQNMRLEKVEARLGIG